MTFIQDRDFPGGPLGFNFGEYNAPANLMTTTAYVVLYCIKRLHLLMLMFYSFVILNWFADGLLVRIDNPNFISSLNFVVRYTACT